MNKSKLYKDIIKSISETLKFQLNEMAKKTVNRTIDKKLWLTVSSIISRNRSTEAENIKPIGDDKNNLLQRYVAALLIMKKPCPDTIEDIGKLKTFKKIGYKFIDLGGTIQDIQKLYNENSGNNSNISTNSDNIKNDTIDNNITTDSDNSDDDDDFFSNFGKSKSDDSEDGFLNDIDSDIDDIHSKTTDSIVNLTTVLDNKSDLEAIYYHVINAHEKPMSFKLIKPTKKTEYQYYIFSQDSNKINRGSDLINKLRNKGWIKYSNPVNNAMYSCQRDFKGRIYDRELLYNISTPTYVSSRANDQDYVLPININQDNHTLSSIHNELNNIYTKKLNYFEEKSNAYKNMTMDKNYNTLLSIYNDLDNTIDNKVVANLFKSSSFIREAIISPDGGLILYSKVNITEIVNLHQSIDGSNVYKTEEFVKSRFKNNNPIIIINYDNLIVVSHTIDYILTFTGKVQYNNLLLNDDFMNNKANRVNEYKLHKKQYSIFMKMLDQYGHNLMDMFPWELKRESKIFKKIGNTYGVSAICKGWGKGLLSNTETVINKLWGKRKNPNKVDIPSTSIRFKYDSIYTTRNINCNDNNVIACVKTTNDMFILKQFKVRYGENYPLLQVELLPKGLEFFKELCKNKNVPLE